MVHPKIFFILFVLIGFHNSISAQDVKTSERDSIRGLWEIRPGIYYFFDASGGGNLYLGDDSDPIGSFTYTIDSTSQHLFRVHLQFLDTMKPEACFIYEPGEKNQLIIYAFGDPSHCPEKVNEPDIRQVIWTRPSYGGK